MLLLLLNCRGPEHNASSGDPLSGFNLPLNDKEPSAIAPEKDLPATELPLLPDGDVEKFVSGKTFACEETVSEKVSDRQVYEFNAGGGGTVTSIRVSPRRNDILHKENISWEVRQGKVFVTDCEGTRYFSVGDGCLKADGGKDYSVFR